MPTSAMIVRAVRWLWRCNWVTGTCTGASSRAMAPADRPRLAARWVMMACWTAAFSTGLRVEPGPAFQMISPPASTGGQSCVPDADSRRTRPFDQPGL